jgi:hypothetical protein
MGCLLNILFKLDVEVAFDISIQGDSEISLEKNLEYP